MLINEVYAEHGRDILPSVFFRWWHNAIYASESAEGKHNATVVPARHREGPRWQRKAVLNFGDSPEFLSIFIGRLSLVVGEPVTAGQKVAHVAPVPQRAGKYGARTERAAARGFSAKIHPPALVIAAADRPGVAMVFTRVRHFRH